MKFAQFLFLFFIFSTFIKPVSFQHFLDIISSGQSSKFESLLSSNIDVNEYRSKNKNSLLHLAAGAPSEAILKLLLDHHASIDALNDRNETPIFTAIRMKRHFNVLCLIQSGADIFVQNKQGQTPRVMAESLLKKFKKRLESLNNKICSLASNLSDEEKTYRKLNLHSSIEQLEEIVGYLSLYEELKITEKMFAW